MKDLAKTEMGENGESFRRPQTGLPWFAQRFGESAAVSRYGGIAFTEFAVRRHEREDNFTLLGQRCSKAKEVLHRVATEVLRNPQQRAEGTGVVRETMFGEPFGKVPSLQVDRYKSDIRWSDEPARTRL